MVRTSASATGATLAPSGMVQYLLDLAEALPRRERQAANLVEPQRANAQGGRQVVRELPLVVHLRHKDLLAGADELPQPLLGQRVEHPRMHRGYLVPLCQGAVHRLANGALGGPPADDAQVGLRLPVAGRQLL